MGTLNNNLFVSESGELYRDNNFAVPLRAVYKRHYSRIDNSEQLRATLRAGKYTDLGSYPLFLLTGDGNTMCFDCAITDYKSIARDRSYGKSFQIIACDVNYEDSHMYCCECNKPIESAYGEPEEGEARVA